MAILDYPFAGTDANAAGAAPALASLLARGLPLREAVEQAHRYETGIGTAVRVAAR